MRHAVTSGSNSVDVVDAPSPTPKPGDMVVRMAACGVCGSDVEKIYGQYSQPSTRLGHETSGVIVSVGDGVKGFSVGDRVFTHHHVPCYDCYLCKHGSSTRCSHYSKSNLLPCGLADEYIVPAWNVQRGGVLKIPDTMSFEQAAMIEPLACCIRAWSGYDHKSNNAVAIFGVGATGMLHVLLAQNKGFSNIYCIDMNQFRLDFVKDVLGAEIILAHKNTSSDILYNTEQRGVDLAIVSTGSMAALESAIHSVRYGGTIMLFGVPSKDATMQLNMDYVYSHELKMYCSYAASDNDTREALHLISEGLDVDCLITHRYDLVDSPKAFERARSGHEAVKIIIKGPEYKDS